FQTPAGARPGSWNRLRCRALRRSMPERSMASCAGWISIPSPAATWGIWKEPVSSRLMLASQDPRFCGVIGIPCSPARAAMRRRLGWLSAGSVLGNDQLGVPGSNPGVLPTRQLSEATNLILVGPDDQMLPRRRAPPVDPTPLDPIVDLLGDDAESPGQVGDPPFVLTDEVVAEQLTDEAEITDQRPDRSRRERAASTRRHETLGVEPRGDLRQG